MADLYIVTSESDDGMWFDEPMGFDTEVEAETYAQNNAPSQPKGISLYIYRCDLQSAYDNQYTPDRAALRERAG